MDMLGNHPRLDDRWSELEFSHVDLGDDRLNRRLVSLAQTLSEYPLNPINQACGDPHQAKAGYRFFSNERVTTQGILESHRRQTCHRMEGEPFIFLIEDTSFIDFTSHLKTEGLGKIGRYLGGKNNGKGLVMHTTLALNCQGIPLGILDQQIWARAPKPKKFRSKELYRTPIEKKESFKWLSGLRESMSHIWQNLENQPSVVLIADREADIFEFLEDALDQWAHFIIRANKDRVLIRPGDKVRNRAGTALHTLSDALRDAPVAGLLDVEVPKRPSTTKSVGTPTRTAKVSVSFCQIKVALPRKVQQRSETDRGSRRQAHGRALDLNAIWVREENPPKGVDCLDWLLLTDLTVSNLAEAEEIICHYRLRWQVELFHKILKSGCRVEDCRLGTAERLKKFLTLSSIISWRILWMSALNKQAPQASCECVLTEDEWKALFCKINKTRSPPTSAPTVRQAIHWIARLGGFLGRKSDGGPGITAIWRGWQRLGDVADDWKIFRPP